MRRLLVLFALAGCGPAASDAADLILTNATVYTGDSTATPSEAVAVKDGRIIYVGDAAGAEDDFAFRAHPGMVAVRHGSGVDLRGRERR